MHPTIPLIRKCYQYKNIRVEQRAIFVLQGDHTIVKEKLSQKFTNSDLRLIESSKLPVKCWVDDEQGMVRLSQHDGQPVHVSHSQFRMNSLSGCIFGRLPFIREIRNTGKYRQNLEEKKDLFLSPKFLSLFPSLAFCHNRTLKYTERFLYKANLWTKMRSRV